ncbi:MAG: biotin/lipoyl-binding protein, partial [Candidatus Sulfotelmatobacter sp.]
MERTTQSPPAAAENNASEKNAAPAAGETRTSPLPSTEKDFQRWPHAKDGAAFRVVVGIAVVVLLVAAFFVYRHVSSYESTDDAQVDGHLNSISARISGHVIKLNVRDNQYVEAGTVLVEIDPADYQVAYDRAKADFEDAQAAAIAAGVNVPITSVNTTSQVSVTGADVENARAGIQAAKQQFEAAKARLQEAEANNVK